MLAGLPSYLFDDPTQHAGALDITPIGFLNPRIWDRIYEGRDGNPGVIWRTEQVAS